jgi:hypothetical protein
MRATRFNWSNKRETRRTGKHYIEYYQEDVQVHAEVMRTSLYKKPKLRIQLIQKVQLELGLVILEKPEEQQIHIMLHED